MIILKTTRLTFRHHEEGYLEEFCSVEQDPQVRRFVGGRAMSQNEREIRFREIFLPQRLS
jgi:hypothetical protein